MVLVDHFLPERDVRSYRLIVNAPIVSVDLDQLDGIGSDIDPFKYYEKIISKIVIFMS